MFKSGYDSTPEKIPSQAGFEPGIFRSRGGRLNEKANVAVRLLSIHDNNNDNNKSNLYSATIINLIYIARYSLIKSNNSHNDQLVIFRYTVLALTHQFIPRVLNALHIEQGPHEEREIRTPGVPLWRRPPRWPSGKASASRAEGPGFESRSRRRDFFLGRVIPVTSTLALQRLPGQAPGVIGSALGLVGPGVSIL